MKKILATLLIITALVTILGYVGSDDLECERLKNERYCEMVELHRSNPELGWPDYNNNYDTLCKNR